MSKTGKKRKLVIPPEIEHLGEPGVRHYKKCLRNGCSEAFALMLVLRQPPNVTTDREFYRGRHNLRQQFAGDPKGFNTVLRQAKKNGYVPRPGDVYEPGLCRPGMQGDPEAFVPATGGRDYIKKLLEKRGESCDGLVKVRSSGSKSQPAKPIDERAAEQFIVEKKKTDKHFAKASKKEQIAEVARKHGSRADQ